MCSTSRNKWLLGLLFTLAALITPTRSRAQTCPAAEIYYQPSTQSIYYHCPNAAAWIRVPITGGGGGGGLVTSVFTRIGDVVAQAGDYTAAQVTNAFDTSANNTLGPHYFDMTAIPQPANPGTLLARVYFDSASGKLNCVDVNGTYCINAPKAYFAPAWNASLTFSSASDAYYRITLAGNVTSTTVPAPTIPAGNTLEYNFTICQPAAGGTYTYTFSWPSSFNTAPSILTGAGVCTPARFLYNGSTWDYMLPSSSNPFYQTVQQDGVSKTQRPILNVTAPMTAVDNAGNTSTDIAVPPFVGAGASHAAGLVPDPGATAHNYPLCDTGTFAATCQSAVGSLPNPVLTGSLVGGAPWGLDINVNFKGPNPYVDVTRYNTRAVNPATAPAIPGITGTITSTSTSLLISAPSTFQNGDGIDVQGAGANITMSTPSAPTATPSGAAAAVGSGIVAAAPSGGSGVNCYVIVARDTGQGLTAKSAEVCTTTSYTLGAQSASITSSAIASNSVITVTTATPTNIGVGYIVRINGTTNDAQYGSWQKVDTVISSTQFTYKTGNDTRSGATTTGSTGGTVRWWNCNHLVLPSPGTGVWQYGIYAGSTGAETLVGVSQTVSSTLSGDPTYMTWDDWGTTMTTGTLLPYFWPTTPPSSAVPDTLVTTIVSGAGTTTLTLADAASNDATTTKVLYDSVPNIKAAFVDANPGAAKAGTVYFPVAYQPTGTGTACYVTNSYLDLSSYSGVGVNQANCISLGDTMRLVQHWDGQLTPSNLYNPSFGIGGGQSIYTNRGNPGVLWQGTAWMSGVSIISAGNGYRGTFLGPGSGIPDAYFAHMNFTGGSATDYTGIPFTMFAQYSAGGLAGVRFVDTSFTVNNGIAVGTTARSLLVSKNWGEISFDGLMMAGAGMFFDPNQSGLGVAVNTKMEVEGSNVPIFSCAAPNGGQTGFNIQGEVLDTTSEPLLSNFGCNPYITTTLALPGSGAMMLSGLPMADVQVAGTSVGALTRLGQNKNTSYRQNGVMIDGYYNPQNTGTMTLEQHNTEQGIGPGYAQYTIPALTLGAPTAVPCTGGVGGCPSGHISISGGWTFKYAPVYPNGGVGTWSPFSSACTVDGATQNCLITIPSPISGVLGYAIGTAANNAIWSTTPLSTTTLTYYATGGPSTSGGGASIVPGGGPVGASDNKAWDYQHITTGYQDFSQQTGAPANPSSGYCRNYFDQSSGLMKALNSLGASCGPSGSGGGSANGPLYALQTTDGAGNFVGIAMPASPDGVSTIPVSTPSGGIAQAITMLRPGIATRKVTGASDTILIKDLNNQVLYTNGGAVAVSVPAPSTSGWSNPIFATVTQVAGTAVTFTPTSGTINGGGTFPQATGVTCTWKSTDNTNWDNVVCPNAASVTGTGTNGHLTKFTGTSSVGNADLTGDVTTSGGVATTIAANAVTPAKAAASLARRVCDIPVGDTSSSTAITSAQLGPQSRLCYVPAAATIVEIDVAADAGTPNVIVGLNHAGSISNLLSGALSTASSGGIACSNTGGTTGLDGATTCSATLQNTSAALGDYIELVSGTADGTAKLMTIHVIYSVTGSL